MKIIVMTIVSIIGRFPKTRDEIDTLVMGACVPSKIFAHSGSAVRHGRVDDNSLYSTALRACVASCGGRRAWIGYLMDDRCIHTEP